MQPGSPGASSAPVFSTECASPDCAADSPGPGGAVKHDVADAVRGARRDRGWTQVVLAERAGVSRPTVARIEGGRLVALLSLAKVAMALGLRVRVSVESPAQAEPDLVEVRRESG